MSAPAFTPPPWDALLTDSETHAVVSPADKNDARPWFTAIIQCADEAIEDANAHLIAAAPELYEMVQALVEYDGRKNRTHINERATALLAKARGEQQ